jgi:hypothetical protein
MPEYLAQSLDNAVALESVNLSTVTDEQASVRAGGSAAWSRKEELGHLIDSAVNNHLRFARATLERGFNGPSYEQDGWVQAHGYHEWPWHALIDAWRQHNAALVQLIKRIPEDRLAAPCVISGAAAVTLRFLIEDYILHMQHHLDHVLSREKITEYPGAAAGI